jgi:RNA-binding protein YhbY
MKHDIVQLQVGKNGLTDAFIGQARKILETERAIKISLLKSSTRNRSEAEEIGKRIVEALGGARFKYHLIGWTIIVKKGRKEA